MWGYFDAPTASYTLSLSASQWYLLEYMANFCGCTMKIISVGTFFELSRPTLSKAITLGVYEHLQENTLEK
jgi:hypothetical protein